MPQKTSVQFFTIQRNRRRRRSVVNSVTRKKSPNVNKSCNKSPNLVTLVVHCVTFSLCLSLSLHVDPFIFLPNHYYNCSLQFFPRLIRLICTQMSHFCFQIHLCCLHLIHSHCCLYISLSFTFFSDFVCSCSLLCE